MVLIGITIGCIYALVALGYTLVYGILELINFAHGDVFMLGGMFSVTFATAFGLQAGQAWLWPLVIVVLLISMILCGAINATIEFVAYRPLRNAPRLAPLITAIGVSFIIEDAVLIWKGPAYVNFPDVLPEGNMFSIGSVGVPWETPISIAITVPVLLLLLWLVQRTKQGKAMRATAQDMDASAIMGINVNRTISFTFLIAGALAGAAGLVYALVRRRRSASTGLPARSDRLHRRGARRDRQPAGRRARRDPDRADPGVQRGLDLVLARLGLDAVDRLHDPDPDPRLPAGGAARRADTGRRLRCGHRPEGLRNRLRARWRGLPRRGATPGAPVRSCWLVIALWLLDHALGYGAAVVIVALWLPRLPPLPWRLAVEAAVVVAFAMLQPARRARRSRSRCDRVLALLDPDRATGGWAIPLAALVDRGRLSRSSSGACSRSRCSACSRMSETGVVIIVFMMMAVGLNIVVGYAGLLDLGYVAFYATGAYTAAWFASPSSRAKATSTSAGSTSTRSGPAGSTSRSGSCS